MGFFDSISKAINDSGIKEGLNSLGQELDKAAKDVSDDFNKSGLKEDLKKFGKDIGITSGSTNSEPKKVPEDYMSFPQFEGTIKDLSTKKIDKYHRCTIDYKDVTEDQVNAYVVKMIDAGFTKGSDVRYDKDNTYIILEKDVPNLHLVFHVKH